MGTDEDAGAPPTLTAEQAALLKSSNDARCANLEAKAGGNASLDNAFDVLRMMTLLEHIATALGIQEQSELDFQGRREHMIAQLEEQYDKMLAAKAAADRAARLAGGPVGMRGGAPQVPGFGGKIVRP